MLLLVPMLVLGWRSRRFADLGLLAGSVGLALLANAFVCGALVNPHDRYGARLAWMAPLVLLLAIWRWREQQQTLRRGPAGRPASPGRSRCRRHRIQPEPRPCRKRRTGRRALFPPQAWC